MGDLTFYDGTITTRDWLHALNGEITFIQGNHDEDHTFDCFDDYVLETERRRYYCTHRPEDVPEDWDGWLIHGHKHNNDFDQYPFLHPAARRVNIAPELVGYTPLPVSELEKQIAEATSKIRAFDTKVLDVEVGEKPHTPPT